MEVEGKTGAGTEEEEEEVDTTGLVEGTIEEEEEGAEGRGGRAWLGRGEGVGSGSLASVKTEAEDKEALGRAAYNAAEAGGILFSASTSNAEASCITPLRAALLPAEPVVEVSGSDCNRSRSPSKSREEVDDEAEAVKVAAAVEVERIVTCDSEAEAEEEAEGKEDWP
jgi:hypothetical protein